MKQLQSIKAIRRIMALTGLSPVIAAESTLMIKDLSVNQELDYQTLSAVSGGMPIECYDIEDILDGGITGTIRAWARYLTGQC
jgi:hypothetical protein